MARRSTKWIECGHVGRPWGIKGQLSVFWNSEMCPVEIGRGSVYTRNQNGGCIPHLVLALRKQRRFSVVTFDDIKNVNDALALKNEKLYVLEKALPLLPKNEFYCYQIIGLQVETESGEVVGTITKIFSTGSNDVYEVKRCKVQGAGYKAETILIPAIDSVIIKVDIENGRMIIRPMKGMI